MSQTQMITIVVKDVICPCCGAPEVNPKTKLLNIRGFKVSDRHGSWSQCLLDHELSLDGRKVKVGKIWFVEKDDGSCLIEVEGKLYVYQPDGR